jgi:hypothetical protein
MKIYLPEKISAELIVLATTSNPFTRRPLKSKTITSPWDSFTMSKCRICEQNLVIELDPESFDEATASTVGQAATAPDDLLLRCGCHFHWLVPQFPSTLVFGQSS